MFIFYFFGLDGLAQSAGMSSLTDNCSITDSYDSGPLMNGVIPNSAVFKDYQDNYRKTPQCNSDSSEYFIAAACSSLSAKLLLVFMIVSGALYTVMFLLSLLLSIGFSFFSNIPAEGITTDSDNWRIYLMGALCKKGPKILRTANVSVFASLLSLVVLAHGFNMCRGDLGMTSNCINFYDNCLFNQIKNCLYYYSSHCQGPHFPHTADADLSVASDCRTASVASRFSGRFDVRVVYPTICQRCWVLHFDCGDPDINKIRMVRANDGYSECVDKSVDCPYYGSAALTAINCNCPSIDPIKNYDDSRLNTGNCQTSVGACVEPSAKRSFAASGLTNLEDAYTARRSEEDFFVEADRSTQECSWASSADPAYYYQDQECSQSGSYVSRLLFMGCYMMLFIGALMMSTGAIVRLHIQIETWCYDPPKPDENVFWKFARLTGPG